MYDVFIACKNQQVIWQRCHLFSPTNQIDRENKHNNPNWMKIEVTSVRMALFAYKFFQEKEILPNYSNFEIQFTHHFSCFFSFLSFSVHSHTRRRFESNRYKNTHARARQQRWSKANAPSGKCPASIVQQTKADKWRKATQQFDSIHTVPWASAYPTIVDGCQWRCRLSHNFGWNTEYFRWKYHTNGTKSYCPPANDVPTKAVS